MFGSDVPIDGVGDLLWNGESMHGGGKVKSLMKLLEVRTVIIEDYLLELWMAIVAVRP